MRVRSAALFALAATVAVGSSMPADAAAKKKKKPIVKEYDLQLAPYPDATETTGCEGPGRTEDVNMDNVTIKVTGPGVLTVKVTEFTSDWDMAVFNASGANVAQGAGTVTPNTSTDPQTETLKYKSKKAQTLTLRVCNFLGGPTAHVKYTYVYN